MDHARTLEAENRLLRQIMEEMRERNREMVSQRNEAMKAARALRLGWIADNPTADTIAITEKCPWILFDYEDTPDDE